MDEEDGVGWLVVPAAGNDKVGTTFDGESEPLDLLVSPELDGELAIDEEHGFVRVDVDGRSIAFSVWALGTVEAPLDPWVRDAWSYAK